MNDHGAITADSYNWLKILPYLFVLFAALLGLNVFLVLTIGIVFAGIIGLADGSYQLMAIFQGIGEGMAGMYEISLLAILIAGTVEVVRHNGGINYFLHAVTRNIKSKKGAEFSIASLISLTNMATANNTISIIIAGPLAKNIADNYESMLESPQACLIYSPVHPRHAAIWRTNAHCSWYCLHITRKHITIFLLSTTNRHLRNNLHFGARHHQVFVE